MSTLLGRIIGHEVEEENPPENLPENTPLESELDPDPTPAPPGGGFTALAPVIVGKVTPTMKKRIAAELETYVEMLALPLVMRDPHCGGVLHENAKPIADAIAQIISRHPEIAAKFLKTGMFGDWLKLAAVTTPVVSALWAHHGPGARQGVTDNAAELPDDFDPFRAGL